MVIDDTKPRTKKSQQGKTDGYDLIIRLHEENEELKRRLEKKDQEIERLTTASQNQGFSIFKKDRIKEKNNLLRLLIPLLIPVLILAYVLFTNHAPVRGEYMINVGALGDNDSTKEFYLKMTPNLGPAIEYENRKYRELNGTTYAVFNPTKSIIDRKVTVSIAGNYVFIVPQTIDFVHTDYAWDLKADFSNEIGKDWKSQNNNIVKHQSNCGAYFEEGKKLYLPNTAESYENNALTVYAEWTPKKSNESYQQVIGHFNWELLQNTDSVQFTVGKMNNSTGPFHTILYKLGKDFFGKKHSALAIYNPSNNGYIELYIDEKFVERLKIGKDKIWAGYNNQANLSIGKSDHSVATYYKGCIERVLIMNKALNLANTSIVIENVSSNITIPIFGNGEIYSINLTIK